ELLEQPLERRAALACDARGLTGKAEPDGVLRCPDHDLLALGDRGGRNEKRDGDTLGVLEARREVDQQLAFHCVFHTHSSLAAVRVISPSPYSTSDLAMDQAPRRRIAPCVSYGPGSGTGRRRRATRRNRVHAAGRHRA